MLISKEKAIQVLIKKAKLLIAQLGKKIVSGGFEKVSSTRSELPLFAVSS
jgi:hypothetical protein